MHISSRVHLGCSSAAPQRGLRAHVRPPGALPHRRLQRPPAAEARSDGRSPCALGQPLAAAVASTDAEAWAASGEAAAAAAAAAPSSAAAAATAALTAAAQQDGPGSVAAAAARVGARSRGGGGTAAAAERLGGCGAGVAGLSSLLAAPPPPQQLSARVARRLAAVRRLGVREAGWVGLRFGCGVVWAALVLQEARPPRPSPSFPPLPLWPPPWPRLWGPRSAPPRRCWSWRGGNRLCPHCLLPMPISTPPTAPSRRAVPHPSPAPPLPSPLPHAPSSHAPSQAPPLPSPSPRRRAFAQWYCCTLRREETRSLRCAPHSCSTPRANASALTRPLTCPLTRPRRVCRCRPAACSRETASCRVPQEPQP